MPPARADTPSISARATHAENQPQAQDEDTLPLTQINVE